MTEFKREFTLTGAYAHPKYGRCSMRMFFHVIGPKGAISVSMFTSWYLPSEQQEMLGAYSKYPYDPKEQFLQPHLCSIDYHAREPQYEGQSAMANCRLLDGADCYFDGTSLWFGEAWMEGFLNGGSDWLYERMEEEYGHRFEGGAKPDLTPIPAIKENE